MQLNPIPQPSKDVPRAVHSILQPMRDAIQSRFFSRSNERVITRADLVRLGLVTQAQLDTLED